MPNDERRISEEIGRVKSREQDERGQRLSQDIEAILDAQYGAQKNYRY